MELFFSVIPLLLITIFMLLLSCYLFLYSDKVSSGLSVRITSRNLVFLCFVASCFFIIFVFLTMNLTPKRQELNFVSTK